MTKNVESLVREARETVHGFEQTPGWHVRTLLVELADALADAEVRSACERIQWAAIKSNADKAIAEVARLRDALEWYAKRRQYEYDIEEGSPVWKDNGERAREALRQPMSETAGGGD